MFQCSVDVIKRLIRYLSSTGDLVIGERYSHVSIITYGVQDTVVYDGIGVSGQAENLTSCNLQSKFPDTVVPTAGSVLYTVLERAETIFQKSDQVRKDSNSPRANKRVVLLVSDGEETNEGSDAKDIAKRIRELPATILSMAQDGQWLTPQREDLLISLANDRHHYACRSQWSQALEEYEKEIPDTKDTWNSPSVKCKWDCACTFILYGNIRPASRKKKPFELL
uniref:VWFA domain-containing protein n=1 Tax=Capitella teleta TaxID=283909 RepID=X1ZWJ1_CAPTE